jgi:beta-glucanase (GH16 family)
MRHIPLIALLAAAAASPQSPAPSRPTSPGWKLAWSDEFNGPANTAPDASKWVYDLGHGGDGWGNKELEAYTNSLENVHLDGQGSLIIRALRDESGSYTSARLKTKGKFTTASGKIEARIKLPYGQGIWPAFWALGADIDTVGWPKCGEIDIMENIGREPGIQHGSLHGPGYSGGNSVTATIALPNDGKLSDDFHVYAVVWTTNSIEFFFDGKSYLKAAPESLPAGKPWVFNKPFFLLLNVAVGGEWPGSPNSSTIFPQDMSIDYVRVYEPTTSH